MEKQPQAIVTFNHVNPKVSEAFTFLAQALGIQPQIRALEPEKPEVKVEEVTNESK